MQVQPKIKGTHTSEESPWQSYAREMDLKMNPRLAKEVEIYSQKHHTKSSQQNEEALAEQLEMSQAMSKQYQFIDPKEYADVKPRVGRPMHSAELINRLRQIGIQCWYRQHPHADKLVLVVQRKLIGPLEIAGWVQAGWTTEFEILRFDSRGLVVNSRYRGWRTVLLQLILKGVLTEQAVREEFGLPVGPASSRYLRTLYDYRNFYKAV
jgi:hypothetical protein